MTTRAQMAERYAILYRIAQAEQPISCRGVMYRTLSARTSDRKPLGVKGDRWTKTVERDLTIMRRKGIIPHEWISESGRQPLAAETWSTLDELIGFYAAHFRRGLWDGLDVHVEVWAEAASMIGTIEPVTDELDVILRPTEGFSSETLAWNAARRINAIGKPTFIYEVGDFDPYGFEAWEAIQDRLAELTAVEIGFERVAATVEHRDRYLDLTHPVKAPKNNHASSVTRVRKWTDRYGDRALEAEAVPTPQVRALVRAAIMRHISRAHIDAVTAEQNNDRAELSRLTRRYREEI